MKQKKNKKKWVAVATSLAAIAALAATFAWFTAEDSAKNHFEGSIAGGDVEVVETFTPPTDWKPGQKVNKDVSVINTGNYKSLVRATFDEQLQILQNAESKLSSDAAVLNGKTKEDIYLTPFNEAVSAGWNDSDFEGEAPKLIVTDGAYTGTYTLKAKETQVTTDAGTTYRYASYWENGTDKFYAKVGTYSRNGGGKIKAVSTPEFKYVDLAKKPLVDKKWTNPVYKPTITVDGDGKATVIAYSDAKPEGNEFLTLEFVNLSATPTENKWFYNNEDGFFYYVGVLDAQTQTPQLLDSVTLSQKAGNEYSKFEFDLTVKASSIQAAKEAVDSDQWLNGSNTTLSGLLSGLITE
ncbi:MULTISPECIES: BsaA family SipW-dependent biofilm matrix protein [Vagococcus]|uniref:Alternate signal-mediated exported protein, CPF_0494 family n=1 Tax=Vagococcus fluvialis bH819 TaxID=1255619 RepID=A0A1X6WLU3_9ENTE|nr:MULTISPECIES: BsaA family SipW-dependent biofilm matrix protein [Vagococcus]SLM85229.1 hypothetical protein FM121_03960 [Vagococcus fluvialis bH819]HCM88357.1 hypothetical protein [Vagococcus sp.]